MNYVSQYARTRRAQTNGGERTGETAVAAFLYHNRDSVVHSTIQSLDRLALIIFVAILCVLTGCVHTDRRSEAPPSAPLPMGDAMRAASSLRHAEPGRTAIVGRGQSMAPLYGDGTVVVFTPVEFASLEAGTVVAYRNRANRTVVHRLVRREADGWVAEGLANPYEDAEKVTADNLLGVVYGVFYTGD